MIEIEGTFSDFMSAMQNGKKAILRGNKLSAGSDVGMDIGFQVSGSSCITLFPLFEVVNVHIYRQTIKMRWMAALNKWQDITRLFAEYGREGNGETERHISNLEYDLQHGCIVPVPDITDPDFTVMYEIQHNRMYIHCFVYNWSREVMRRLKTAVNKLQTDHPIDNYIYSIRPNEEYALCNDTTFKFAKMAGYDFLETVVLGDGYEHDIYKRDKNNVTRFVSKHV